MASINVCVFGSYGGLKSTSLCGVLGRGFVERIFLRNRSIWHLAVATEAGRYVVTFSDVTPCQVVN